MDVEEKIGLIEKPPTEEIITKQELRELFETKESPLAYDGFEPSGLAHLGSGLVRAIKLNDFIKAGCKFKLLIADWFAWINNKMGGDLDKIQKAGKYLVKAWESFGIDKSKVEIIWTSDMVDNRDYWKRVISVAKVTTIKRMLRCSPIMGRKEGEMLYAAQLFYPSMQAADPFELGVDICQLGMDQRHATILSREVADKIKEKKPVCIHHHLLLGLLGQRMGTEQAGYQDLDLKMSKSKPDSAIFIHDTDKDIKRKLKKAYCPEKQVEDNPIIDICRNIVFRKYDGLKVERPEKFGGNLEFSSFDELVKTYKKGELHPLDLKNSVAEKLIEILEPSRKFFKNNREARELYEFMKSQEITR